MSHTQTNKPAGAIGAQAAAAATTNGKPADAKPADAKPTETKPTEVKPTDAKATDAKPDDKAAGGGTEGADDKKNKNPNKIYVVVGQVHEFETTAKAEKFLNGDDAPTEYAVIRGKKFGTKKRVSLR